MIIYYYTNGKGITNDAKEAGLGVIPHLTWYFEGTGGSHLSTGVHMNDACVVNTHSDSAFHLLMLLKYGAKWCKLSGLEHQTLVLMGTVRFTHRRTKQIEAEILNS